MLGGWAHQAAARLRHATAPAKHLRVAAQLLPDAAVAAFEADGACVVRGAFSEWVEDLRVACERNMQVPGPLCDEHSHAQGSGGRSPWGGGGGLGRAVVHQQPCGELRRVPMETAEEKNEKSSIPFPVHVRIAAGPPWLLWSASRLLACCLVRSRDAGSMTTSSCTRGTRRRRGS